MKKISVLFLISIFIFSFVSMQIILAQDLNEIQQSIDDKSSQLDEKKQQIEEFGETAKWEYLSKEWRNILLKNKVIAGIDSFFKKINFVFVFLFGENYSISLTLLFVIIFWIFFFINFYRIFKDYSFLSQGVSLGVSFLIVIISAQFHLYRFFSELVFKLLFYKEGIWGWIWFFILMLVLVIIIIMVKYFGKVNVKKREQMKKVMADIDREILHKEAEKYKKISEELEK